MTREELKKKVRNLFRTSLFKGWKVYDYNDEPTIAVVFINEEGLESPPIRMHLDGRMVFDGEMGEVGDLEFTPQQMIQLASVYNND